MPQATAVKRKQTANQTIDLQLTKHLKQASDALQNLTNKTSIQTNVPQDGAAPYGSLLAKKLSTRTRLILEKLKQSLESMTYYHQPPQLTLRWLLNLLTRILDLLTLLLVLCMHNNILPYNLMHKYIQSNSNSIYLHLSPATDSEMIFAP